MAFDFQSGTITYNGQENTHTFSSPVQACCAVLQGVSLSYGNEDHWIKTLNSSISIQSFDGTTVSVLGALEMEDNSGHEGTGQLNYIVLAVTA
jgi:hypothetical protein